MKALLYSLFFTLSIPCFAQQDTISALFLGNSYTYYNGGVPAMIIEMAEENGNVFTFESNTPGGYTFNGHSTNNTSLDLLAQGGYDFLVLQEQSQIPSFPQSQVAVECYPYAETLCDLAREASPCIMPLFFMTWGRENGDASNCEFWPPICTYEGMQTELSASYINMAEMNQGMTAPSGDIWRNLRMDHPEIDLYIGDGSHPSVAGTFVVAATMYASMFGELATWVPEGFDQDWASHITDEVQNLVLDNGSDYFLDREFSAEGDLSNHYVEGQILNLQPEASSHVESMNVSVDGELIASEVDLDYGIDISTWLPGPYTISVEFNSVCGQGYDEFVFVVALSVEEVAGVELTVFPNPASDRLFINSNHAVVGYSLMNSLGQVVLQNNKAKEVDSIDLELLPSGVYSLQMETLQGKVTRKIVVED